jgi:hypothetical protein
MTEVNETAGSAVNQLSRQHTRDADEWRDNQYILLVPVL